MATHEAHPSTPRVAGPTEATRVSVIIASWNGWGDLEKCLQSLHAGDESGDGRTEIIVVDNGSVDGSVRNVRQCFPRVHLIENRTNLGHTRAVNQGIRAARGCYLVVLDADTVVEGDTLATLVNFMDGHPEAAIAAPRMFNPDGSVQETARNFPTPINGLLGRQSLLTRWFPNNRFTRGYMRSGDLGQSVPFAVDWVSAACMIFPADLVRSIGPWDEGYHSYWVDADWCMRAVRAGGRVYCVPAARVVHHEQNRRGKKKSADRIVKFNRSVYRFYRKHYTRGVLDPRAVFAAAALSARTVVLVLGNMVLPRDAGGTAGEGVATPVTGSRHQRA